MTDEEKTRAQLLQELAQARQKIAALEAGEERQEPGGLQWRALLRHVRAGVVVHGPDTRILASNPAAQELLNLTEEQMEGRTSQDARWVFFRENGDPMPVQDYPVNRVLSTGQPLRHFIVGVRRPEEEEEEEEEEEITWVLLNAEPDRDAEGRIARVIVTFMDISERRRMEQELRDSRDFLSRTGAMARVGGWEIDLKNETVIWTQTTRQIHQVPDDYEPTLEEAISFFPGRSRERIAEAVQRAMEKGEPYDLELDFVTATGERLRVWTIGLPEFEGDQCVRLSGTFQDITEQVRAQEAIQRANAELAQQTLMLDQMLASTSDHVYVFDPEMRFVHASQSGAGALGLRPEEIIGKNWRELGFPERIMRPYQEQVHAVFATGESRRGETDFPTVDGTRYYEYIINPLIDPSGEVTHVLNTSRDITELRRSQQKATRMLRLLEFAIEQIPIPVIIASAPDVTISHFNRGAVDLLTTVPGEVSEIPLDAHREFWPTFYPDGTPYRIQDLPLTRAIQRGDVTRNTEIIIRRQDGDHWISASAAPLRDENGQIIAGIVAFPDITALKQAQEALEQYTQRLEILREIDRAILAAQSPEAIARAALDRIRKLVTCRRASVTVLVPEADESLVLAAQTNGHTELDAGTRIAMQNPSLLDALRQGEAHVTGDLQALENPSPSGQRLLSEGLRAFVNVPLLVEGELIGSLNLGSDKPHAFDEAQIEVAREVADQLAVAIWQARLRDQVQRYADEMEQRVAERTEELQQVNAQLAQRGLELRNINTELETFAYSVSHDLRAPLRAISGFSQIIARRHRADLNEEGRHYLDNIVEASAHMGQLIDDLLRYSRLGRKAVRRRDVSLQEVLDRASRNLDGRVRETGARLTLPDDAPVVQSDPTLLSQIVTNLLDNALTYHRPDAPPEIEVGCRPEADGMVLSVADNGIGIAPEFHEKIFGIFQRLHNQEDYGGTGVGLAIVRKAVRLLNGRVWMESEPGQGSTFFVHLPFGDEE